MIRVAVIENESELQRYGYANVVEKLRNAFKNNHNEYLFYSFTSANIHQLFSDGDDGLFSFDGLFISTNAFSDFEVLAHFRKEKERIIEFVESGKGIFIGYQKKLNIETKYYQNNLEQLKEKIEQNTIDFLPERYQYFMPEAFYEIIEKDEEGKETNTHRLKVKSSSSGEIEQTENYNDVLLNYPRQIDYRKVQVCCMNNSFSQHVYKSYLQFKQVGYYKILFQANSSIDDLDFFPLFARAIPQKNERIVIATIIFDWENHVDVLYNIVEYITKGNPTIAFVNKDGKSNREFDFIINSTKMSKVACCVYNYSDLTTNMNKTSLHDVYCFAPSILSDEVKDFWSFIKNESRSIKMYHLNIDSSSKELIMTHYSNNGLLESIIGKSRLYFKQEFERIGSGFWGGFWNTYDILLMLRNIGENTSSYKERIRNAIDLRQDKNNRSYDNVFGCTLGLITILLLFFEDEKKDVEDVKNIILPWIHSSLNEKTTYDKLSYWMTFKDLSNLLHADKSIKSIITNVVTGEQFSKVNNYLKEEINNIDLKHLSEIELCRWLKFIQLSGLGDEKPKLREEFLNELFNQRDIEGKWINVSRTGYVLISLLTSFSKDVLVELKINNKIDESINFLIDSYNDDEGAWSEGRKLKDNYRISSSATARAIHAINLFNSVFPFTTKDFISVVKQDVNTVNSTAIINNALNSLTQVSKSYWNEHKKNNELNIELKKLNVQYESSQTRIIENEKSHQIYTKNLKITYKKNRNFLILAIVFLSVIAIEQFVIVVNNRVMLEDMWKWVFSLFTTIVGFGVSILLKVIIENKLYPPENKEEDEMISSKQNKKTIKENKKRRKK